jgi:Zn-dependent membrane protease YugP
MTGAQAADEMLHRAGVRGVRIEPTEGFLSDHYVPGEGILRLSPHNYHERSLAALGVAAHEAGHAIQDAKRYKLMAIRQAMVPLASIGSSAAWLIIIAGMIMQVFGLVLVGIVAFGLVVAFQLVNLPVEFDASRRARLALLAGGVISPEEDQTVGKVLNAAAWTYVAATLTGILTLLYFIFRFGGMARDE